ncbi:MAG: DNRLRE domain-containing protein [Candidatus Omnitrophica bacterium]|nr:DNRLRE domain-containing protein [Candidatus Omnitrophota bacterium]
MKKLIFTLVILFLSTTQAYSYDFTLSVIEDTFTDSYRPDHILGVDSSTRLWAGVLADPETEDKICQNYYARTYLKFDLTGISNIESASLWLYRYPDLWGNDPLNPSFIYNNPDGGKVSVYYEANNNWHESSLTWNTAMDLNWLDNVKGTTTDLGVLYSPNNGGLFSWDVTDLIENKTGEVTLALASGVPFNIFYSSESGVNTPYLSVSTNPVPEPASMLLFGIGTTAMAIIKRRKKTI